MSAPIGKNPPLPTQPRWAASRERTTAPLNTLQRKLDVEFAKEEKDTDSIEDLSNKLNQLYQAIMENENMKNYTEKREKFDIMTKFIDRIILVAMNGGDPYSVKEEDCTGNCANCHGCD